MDDEPECNSIFLCPHCEAELPPLIREEEPFVNCPWCGKPVTLQHQEPLAAEEEPDELSALRIRQLVNNRRALFRARTWALIAAVLAMVAAAQTELTAVRYLRLRHPGLWPWLYGAGGLALVAVAIFFARSVLDYTRSLSRSALDQLPPPEGEPDFSGLSDGSQHWKMLDQMGHADAAQVEAGEQAQAEDADSDPEILSPRDQSLEEQSDDEDSSKSL